MFIELLPGLAVNAEHVLAIRRHQSDQPTATPSIDIYLRGRESGRHMRSVLRHQARTGTGQQPLIS